METLDMSSAKEQFFQLVDAISASHLPSFTIWLDAKLAEYKTIGQLKPDTEFETKEQYPEWIAKAFRQNLSFIFAGHPNSTSDAETPDKGICRKRSSPHTSFSSQSKRSKVSSFEPDTGGSEETCIVIKEEGPSSPLENSTENQPFPVSETPLPGIQSSFSLTYSSDFSRHQSVSNVPLVPVADSASLQGHISTRVVSSQSQFQTLSDSNQSIPPPSFSSTSGEFANEPNPQQFEHLNAVPQYKFEESTNISQFPMPVESAASESANVVPVSSVSKPRVDLSPAAIKAAAVLQYSGGFIQEFHGGKPTYSLASCDISQFRNEAGGFTCPQCQKKVRDFDNYKRHVVIHTQETPFHCPYCFERFGDRSHCTKHQGTNHPDKPRIRAKPQI